MADRYRVLGMAASGSEMYQEPRPRPPPLLVKTKPGNIQSFENTSIAAISYLSSPHSELINRESINVASFNDHVRHSLCVYVLSLTDIVGS